MTTGKIIGFSALAATALVLALFRIRWARKAFLTEDMNNITSGDWRPKAGDYLGEVVETNFATGEVMVAPSTGSALEKAGLSQSWFPGDAVSTARGIVMQKRMA